MKLKNLLISDEIANVPEVDSSTGKYIIENEVIVTTQVVVNPKFAEDNQVTIVDL